MSLISNAESQSSTDDEEDQHESVQEALDSFKIGKYQLLLFVTCGLAWMGDGMMMTAQSFIFPKLKVELDINGDGDALLGSMLGAGQVIGAVSMGALSDTVGRRPALRLALAIMIGFGVCSTASQSLGALACFWLLIGVGIGGSLPTAFALLSEGLPAAWRSFFLCCMQVFFKLGALVSTGLAKWRLTSPCSDDPGCEDTSATHWRDYLVMLAVAPVLVLVLTVVVQESPEYLVRAGRHDEAAQVLHRIARANRASWSSKLRRREMEQPSGKQTGAASRRPLVLRCICPAGGSRSLAGLFRSFGDQKTLLVWMCLLWVFMNLGSGLFAWLPMIAKAVELKEEILYDSSLVAQVVGIVSFFTAAVLADRVGHARLLLGAAVACACITAVEALTLDRARSEGWVLGGLNVAWVFFFDIAWPIVYSMTPQIFGVEVRSLALGVSNSCGKAGGMLAPWIGGPLVERGAVQDALWAYAAFWVVVAAISFRLLYEPFEHRKVGPDDQTRRCEPAHGTA